jgi:DNA-binding XRE family transcriptional regulator/tetratricopeptide (TPR) repeat protein
MAVKRRSFAQARRAAGFTQESLAERLEVDRTTVARWESGEYSPQPWLRPKIAEAFEISLKECSQLLDGVGTTESTVEVSASLVKADGVPLAGAEQVEATGHGHERLNQDAELAEVFAAAQAVQALAPLPQVPWETDQCAVSTAHAIVAGVVKATGLELAEVLAGLLTSVACLPGVTQIIPSEWEDRLYDQLKSVLGEWASTMNRRKLLRLLGWAATVVAAAPVSGLDPDEQERLVQAIALPSRVDSRVIDNIEALFQHCKRQEDALGSRIVLDTVLAQRDIIHGLLKDCPDELRPRLLSVYSDMSTSIGYYFFELNDLDRARYYCDQAREAAHDADNTELGIYALCEMSYFASWRGKAPAAIDLAASAESLLRKTDDPLMRVGVAQRSATAYAIDSQYKTCMVQLEQAQANLLSAGNLSVESPLYFYNEGYLASHKSECLLRLGKPQEAAASASAGLTLYDQSFVDGYAVCTLHLGNAYLQAGEIEEAAQVIGQVAALSAQTHSARLTKELRTTRVSMEPWRETRAVKELDEQLVGVGFGVA